MSRYYLVAGESSGDLHGASLIHALKHLSPASHFRGFGGDRMKTAGMDVSFHYRDIAFMGFKEVLLNLRTLAKAIRFCKNDILNYKPDAIILIDYPGFNLRIAEFAKQKGIRTIYYISPQIWAWKEKRIQKIRRNVDKMICILPFEVDFYKKHHFKVDYVGHPLLDHIASFASSTASPVQPIVDKTIAMLPGSRTQEIKKILPEMLSLCPKFPEYTFVIAATSSVDPSLYNIVSTYSNAKLHFDDSYSILKAAQAGIIKSGTSTLEATLFDLPFAVCYKTTGFTYRLSKSMIRVRFISLVNLIMDRMLVREFIQHECRSELLAEELEKLLHDQDYIQKMKNGFNELKLKLGNSGASERAAQSIFDFISAE